MSIRAHACSVGKGRADNSSLGTIRRAPSFSRSGDPNDEANEESEVVSVNECKARVPTMMDKIIFEVLLFETPNDRDASQECLVILMDALAKVNMTYLRTHPRTPTLYQSPIRYYFDPTAPDPWQDIPSTLAKGWGDCEDLACWRIAEYRMKGIDARPLIRWRKNGARYTYHALVRLPDGRTEDPSLSMGMRTGKMLRRPVYLTP